MQGRFTSPDEFKGGPEELWVLGSGASEKQALVYAEVTNPQSLNKYQYAFNNPLRYVDPDGQSPQDGLESQLRRDEKRFLEGKMTEQEFRDRMNARGVGALVGAAIDALFLVGEEAATAILLWAARNPDHVEQLAAQAQEAGGGPPGLTLAPNSRLSAAERDTGERLGKLLGSELREGAHVGEEYLVAGTTKTIDAMGQPRAYQFWNEKQFINAIDDHLRKAVDYVAIDLKGASKAQIKVVTDYVNKLPKEQQARVIYVK